MSGAGTPTEDGGVPPKITLRVYTVTREGHVTSDTGTHGFEGAEAETATSLGQEFPPCTCLQHRAVRAGR